MKQLRPGQVLNGLGFHLDVRETTLGHMICGFGSRVNRVNRQEAQHMANTAVGWMLRKKESLKIRLSSFIHTEEKTGPESKKKKFFINTLEDAFLCPVKGSRYQPKEPVLLDPDYCADFPTGTLSYVLAIFL